MPNLSRKVILRCDPITKTDDKGDTWLVGYRRRKGGRKGRREYWITPVRYTPAKDMQCVDCSYAPHNSTIGKSEGWCCLHRYFVFPCADKVALPIGDVKAALSKPPNPFNE